jgi:osmotically-inducible protein OsmY
MIGHQDEAPSRIGPEPLIDPEMLGERITHALGRAWFFDPDSVSVAVDGTTVKLSGVVRSQRERKLAAAIAWVTSGVSDVENDLLVG